MALIHCPECGKEISDLAISCPNCGYPISRMAVPKIELPPETIQEDEHPEPPKEEAPSTDSAAGKDKGGSMPLRIVLGIILCAVGLILLARGGGWTTNRTSSNSAYITAAEYDQIKTGMSYEDVVKIVGGEGELSAESDVMGVKVEIVTWYAKSPKGANANVTLQNNKVVSKAQFLLE